jgi:hypothetical protein
MDTYEEMICDGQRLELADSLGKVPLIGNRVVAIWNFERDGDFSTVSRWPGTEGLRFRRWGGTDCRSSWVSLISKV